MRYLVLALLALAIASGPGALAAYLLYSLWQMPGGTR
jgi:hypothetical protein